MQPNDEKVHAAKREAQESLMAIPGVVGVGVGDNTVRVYVLNAETKSRLPDSVGGVPIEVVATGDIEAY